MAKKPATIATIKHLSERFNYRLISPRDIMVKSSLCFTYIRGWLC